jgi:hypothetical protein
LVLDAVNWQTGVTVQDDNVVDGERVCPVVTTAAVSTDATYDVEDPAAVVVTVTDDDVVGIKVSPTILAVSEQIVPTSLSLPAEPTCCPNDTQPESLQFGVTVSPVSVVLDAANWSEVPLSVSPLSMMI